MGNSLFYPDNLSPQFVFPNTYIFAGVFIMVIISANLLTRYQTRVPKYVKSLWREKRVLFIVSFFIGFAVIRYRVLKLNMALGTPISNGILLLAIWQCVLFTITGMLVFKCAKHYVRERAALIS